MTLAANTIGNLLSRHLRYDLGEASVQNYNASNGRGYLISADGRVAFFVELGGTTPKYAVSFSVGSLTTTERDARTAAAEAFVAGTSWPTSDAASQTNTSSLFYKAYDAAIIELSKSLASDLMSRGLGVADFANTGMVLEAMLDRVLANAGKADPNSGIRTVIAGTSGPESAKYSKLWIEGSGGLGDDDEIVVLPALVDLTDAQKTTAVDAKGGFDFFSTGQMLTATVGVDVNFATASAQTYKLSNTVTLNLKNFEGTDLTDKDDKFTGGSTNNTVFAGKGTDIIDGGGTTDRDWVRYDNAKSDSSNTAGIKLATNDTSGVMTVTDHGGSKDTLTNVEAVAGTYNKDEFKGGAGNFNQIFAGLKGADVIDGGGGTKDRVWHLDDPSGVVVNLSGASVSTKGMATVVNGIKYAGASNGAVASVMMVKEALDGLDLPVATVKAGTALDGWGTVDTLTGIEGAFGSNFSDMMYGSKDANYFTGGDGLDLLVGYAGDDYLTGGFGHDLFVGGLGRDWIVMDELNWTELTAEGTNYNSTYLDDGEEPGRWVLDGTESGNLISYASVSESLADDSKVNNKADEVNNKADVLDGFVLGNDILDLSGIDANTLRTGNQSFNNIDTQFTKKAGELKVSAFSGLIDYQNYAVSNAEGGYKLSGIKIQGDVNGDGVADFEVKLVGVGTSVNFGNSGEVNALLEDLKDSIFF